MYASVFYDCSTGHAILRPGPEELGVIINSMTHMPDAQ